MIHLLGIGVFALLGCAAAFALDGQPLLATLLLIGAVGCFYVAH